MSTTDPRSEEDEADASTLNGEREGEDTGGDDVSKVFEEIFGDDTDDEDEDDAPVTRAELRRYQKGVQKLATVIGREKKAKQEETKETRQETEAPKAADVNSFESRMFFRATPEALAVKATLEKIAKHEHGGDILSAWEANEEWLLKKSGSQTPAEMTTPGGRVTRPAQGKVGTGSGGNKIPVDQIDLENPEHVKYLRANPKAKAAFSEYFGSTLK